MMCSRVRCFPRSSAKANVLDRTGAPCLAVSFEDATPKTVWFCDLHKESPAGFQIKEESAAWILNLEKPDGSRIAVARFDSHGSAQKALAVIQNALLQPQSFFSRGTGRFLLFLLALVVFWMVFVPVADMSERPEQQAAKKQATESTGPKKQIIEGQPMNADDVLVPPKD